MSTQKANMLALLQQLETEGDAKNSLYEMLKDGVIVLAGAGIGAAIGRPSLLVGLGTSFAGHYLNQPRLTALGMGLIATGGYKLTSGVNGNQVGGLEGAKERLKEFATNIKSSLYVDKFIKSGSGQGGTDGVGEVQYFKYPGNELNMGGLDAIEDEIRKSSDQFSGAGVGATYEDIAGTEERIL